MEVVGWRRPLHVIGVWLLLEWLLPGAALFALLLWLSQLFVRNGLADVRQYAFAPGGSKWVPSAPITRNWWSCTCASLGECRCLAAMARGLRRCCMKLLPLHALPLHFE